jgi:hypothetical protein
MGEMEVRLVCRHSKVKSLDFDMIAYFCLLATTLLLS